MVVNHPRAVVINEEIQKKVTEFEHILIAMQVNKDDMTIAQFKTYLSADGGNRRYNPQIQISAESGTKRSIFRQKNKTKRSKKRLHTTLIKPEQKVNEDLCSGFIVS